jgi:tripartite-type tricarboxylate transporter receptor subunit TctC
MTFILAQLASRVVRTIGVTSLAFLSLQAIAQEVYPNRPVVVISPWAAGGPAEAIIRPIAEKLTQRLGWLHTPFFARWTHRYQPFDA